MNIVITEDEIKKTPNYYELGKLVSQKYWSYINNKESILPAVNIMDYGIKESTINSKYVTDDGFDMCVICGKKTPYHYSDNIQNRFGYVEGVGQGCYKPEICKI
jgi:hypothetical protein